MATMQEFLSSVKQNRNHLDAQREDILARARRLQAALRARVNHLVVSYDEHVPEDRALAGIEAGRPFLCGCLVCCVRQVLPGALMALEAAQGRETELAQ